MPNGGRARTGYGAEVFRRDDYRCRYCGKDMWDFEDWLDLSIDHIIPNHQWRDTPREQRMTLCERFGFDTRYADRQQNDDKKNLVSSCQACNSFANTLTVNIPEQGDWQAAKDTLIEQKRGAIKESYRRDRQFWEENVKPTRPILAIRRGMG